MRRETFEILDNPNLWLALSLSAPSAPQEPDVQTRYEQETSGVLAPSKDTIAFAILLFRLWQERFQERESYYLDQFQEIASEFAQKKYGEAHPLQARLQPFPPSEEPLNLLLSRFEVGYEWVSWADHTTHETLARLEEKGLIIDPVLTATGLMVLVGLIPVHWSVRTPEGEDVYREIKVNAGLWSLEIQKRRRGQKRMIDWEFNFRGIGLVKKALRLWAEEYALTEASDRIEKGKRISRMPKRLRIHGEDEATAA